MESATIATYQDPFIKDLVSFVAEDEFQVKTVRDNFRLIVYIGY